MRKTKKAFLGVAMGIALLTSMGGITTFAQDSVAEEAAVTTEQENMPLSRMAASSIWNSTYTNQYNVKTTLSMSASLLTSSGLPSTTITIRNTGSNPITAIAYKGAILGSNTLCSMTIPAGGSRSMNVTRTQVINNGTLNAQGTKSYLSYTVSLYNINGRAISCKANAIRYS